MKHITKVTIRERMIPDRCTVTIYRDGLPERTYHNQRDTRAYLIKSIILASPRIDLRTRELDPLFYTAVFPSADDLADIETRSKIRRLILETENCFDNPHDIAFEIATELNLWDIDPGDPDGDLIPDTLIYDELGL